MLVHEPLQHFAIKCYNQMFYFASAKIRTAASGSFFEVKQKWCEWICFLTPSRKINLFPPPYQDLMGRYKTPDHAIFIFAFN